MSSVFGKIPSTPVFQAGFTIGSNPTGKHSMSMSRSTQTDESIIAEKVSCAFRATNGLNFVVNLVLCSMIFILPSLIGMNQSLDPNKQLLDEATVLWLGQL